MKTGISPILILLLLGLFPTIPAVAQPELSFAVRGKYLPIYGLEDFSGRTYTYGAELILNNHHSIGVDGTMFRTRGEMDDDDEVAMYSDYERKTYCLIDYKFLMPVNEYNIAFYLNTYWKVNGRYWSWSKKHEYDFGDRDLSFLQSATRGRFSEFGAGLGLKIYFGDSDAGIDISMNLGQKTGFNDIYNHRSRYFLKTNEHVLVNRTIAYMRINFFYHFLR